MGEYVKSDPPELVGTDIVEKSEMYSDALCDKHVIGSTVERICTDPIGRVVLKLEREILLFVHPGENDMILEVEWDVRDRGELLRSLVEICQNVE
jgi:hypothetical protein